MTEEPTIKRHMKIPTWVILKAKIRGIDIYDEFQRFVIDAQTGGVRDVAHARRTFKVKVPIGVDAEFRKHGRNAMTRSFVNHILRGLD